jgi:hypothetical protein
MKRLIGRTLAGLVLALFSLAACTTAEMPRPRAAIAVKASPRPVNTAGVRMPTVVGVAY